MVGGIGTVAGGIDIRGSEQHRVPCQGQGHSGRDAPGDPGLDTVRGVGTETEIVTTDCAPVTGAAFPVKVGQRESHGAEGISHRQVHLLVGGRRKIDRTPGGHRKIPGSQCQRGLKAHARFPDTAPYIAAHEVGATRNFHTALPGRTEGRFVSITAMAVSRITIQRFIYLSFSVFFLSVSCSF